MLWLNSLMAQTAREFSAGGVVVRHKDGQWWVAVIRPTGREASKKKSAKGKITQAAKPVLTLPKGLIDPGEKPEETAVREIQEETGIDAERVVKLGNVKDRKSTRLNSSHVSISYAVFCLKK